MPLNPNLINPEDEVDLLDPDLAPQDQVAFDIPEDDQVDLLAGFDQTQDVGSQVSDPAAPQKLAYLPDVDQTVAYPSTMTDDEANDAIQTGVYGKPRIGFWRMSKEYLKVIPQGLEDLASMTGSLMRLAGKNLKENADAKVMLSNPFTGEPWLYRKGIHITTDPNEPTIKLEVDMDKRQAQFLEEWGTLVEDYWRKQSQSGWEAPDPELFRGSFVSNPSWNRAILTGLRSVPTFALATAVTLRTGQPLAGAATIGILGSAPEATAALDAGKDVTRANQVFTINAITQTVLEVIPLRFIKEQATKKFSQGFVKALLERGGIIAGAAFREGVIEEGTSQLVQNLVAKIGYDKTRSLFDGYVEAVIGGAVSGGAIGGITAGSAQQTENLQKEALNKGITQKELDALWDAVALAIQVKAPEINGIVEASLETNKEALSAGADPEELFQAAKPQFWEEPRKLIRNTYFITKEGETLSGADHLSILLEQAKKLGLDQKVVEQAQAGEAFNYEPYRLLRSQAEGEGALRITVQGNEMSVSSVLPLDQNTFDRIQTFVAEKGLDIKNVFYDFTGMTGHASYQDFIEGKIRKDPSQFVDLEEEMFQSRVPRNRRPVALGQAYAMGPNLKPVAILGDHAEEAMAYPEKFGFTKAEMKNLNKELAAIDEEEAKYKGKRTFKFETAREKAFDKVFKDRFVRFIMEPNNLSLEGIELNAETAKMVETFLTQNSLFPETITFDASYKGEFISGKMDTEDFIRGRWGKLERISSTSEERFQASRKKQAAPSEDDIIDAILEDPKAFRADSKILKEIRNLEELIADAEEEGHGSKVEEFQQKLDDRMYDLFLEFEQGVIDNPQKYGVSKRLVARIQNLEGMIADAEEENNQSKVEEFQAALDEATADAITEIYRRNVFQKVGAPGKTSTFAKEKATVENLLKKHGIEKVTIALVNEIKTPTGEGAFGSYVPNERTVKLINEPLDTTAYHEAFHALARLSASKDTIQAAIKEVMDEKGVSKVEAEEILAEQFAQYAKNQEAKGIGAKARKLFQAVLDTIRRMLGRPTQTNRTLFEELLKPTKQAPTITGLPSTGEAETEIERGATGEAPTPVTTKKKRGPRPLIKPGTEVAAEQPVGTGEEKKSTYFERTKNRLSTLKKENVVYSEMDLAQNAALASRFVEEQPEAARRVALGIDPPPAGVTDIAVSMAYEEYLRDQGKTEDFGRVAKITTLKGTRFGQEIVSFKGAVNEHSPDRFIKQVLLARMEQQARPLLGVNVENIAKGETGTKRTRVRKKITEATDVLKTEIEKKNLSISEAQKVLDSIICP